jgi:hypothetical protein
MKFLKVICLLAVIGVLLKVAFRNDYSPTLPASAEKTSGEHSMARQHAKSVKITLDSSQIADLMEQVPGQPEITTEGELRIYKWRFSDGSAMVARFKPSAQAGAGLVLHMVGFE